MLQKNTYRKLESFKLFPYIAWGLIITFIVFVFKLTSELKDEAASLDRVSSSLEDKLQTKNKDLKRIDFEQ